MNFLIIISSAVFFLAFSVDGGKIRNLVSKHLSPSKDRFGSLVSKISKIKKLRAQARCLLIHEVELETCHGWSLGGSRNSDTDSNTEKKGLIGSIKERIKKYTNKKENEDEDEEGSGGLSNWITSIIEKKKKKLSS